LAERARQQSPRIRGAGPASSSTKRPKYSALTAFCGKGFGFGGSHHLREFQRIKFSKQEHPID